MVVMVCGGGSGGGGGVCMVVVCVCVVMVACDGCGGVSQLSRWLGRR